METIISKIKKGQLNNEVIKKAGEILKSGGLVAFPTETVYGLGADALNEKAAQKIYAAKGRPSDNPLIVHITNMEALSRIVSDIPEEERKSVYFEISPAPYLYSSGSGTYLHELIELAGGRNVLADQNGWISVEGETVAAANPDVIFTNVNYTDDPVGEILGREGWAGVSAVQDKEVYYIDNMASSLPDHNIVIAVEQMARALYPERFGTE